MNMFILGVVCSSLFTIYVLGIVYCLPWRRPGWRDWADALTWPVYALIRLVFR